MTGLLSRRKLAFPLSENRLSSPAADQTGRTPSPKRDQAATALAGLDVRRSMPSAAPMSQKSI
jgi:hypothetical protein